jgi:hypothetical protein
MTRPDPEDLARRQAEAQSDAEYAEVLANQPASGGPVCNRWRPCCCSHAGDSHCWRCGRLGAEHPAPVPDVEDAPWVAPMPEPPVEESR